jgi:antitoxin HicB
MSTMRNENPHIGSSLDDFLKEEGILEETRATALKEVREWQIQKSVKETKLG